ncbi:hypothetical protein TNCT_392251 [Trichonephila clavata]|uniref:Uncharacterized protein n=1 Tax=Trichonephila clavata TaxID=2740835 RepID=A0A8X6KHG3_TRICU|nr:hypothetical protein TNCT_392251 [Trichonephila clavata]
MNGHGEQSSQGEEAMQLGTEPLLATTSDPLEHCAQIKKREKLINIKQLRIRYLVDMIEIETFDKDITDASEIESLIKEKAKAELEFAIQMGELKVLFPCPVPCCQHTNANEINSFRTTQKRPAESPILPAKLIINNNNKNVKKLKPQKWTTSKVDSQTTNPAKKTKQESKISLDKISNDSVIPTSNAFASLGIDEVDSADNDVSIEDTLPSPKVKPIMLRLKTDHNLVLKAIKDKFPDSTNKLSQRSKQKPEPPRKPATEIKIPKTELPKQKKVTPNLSFANAVKSDQQRAARSDKPKPAKNNSKSDMVKNQEQNFTAGCISTMSEFRKLFQRFPGLLEAGKALKNAKSDEERLDIYMGVMASTVTPQPSP